MATYNYEITKAYFDFLMDDEGQVWLQHISNFTVKVPEGLKVKTYYRQPPDISMADKAEKVLNNLI